MQQLTLLLNLTNDPSRSLQYRIARLFDEKRLQSLEGRDDVVLLSDNAILVDQISAHEIFVQLCAGLAERGWPYLLLHLGPESSMAVGTFSEEVSSILQRYGVPLAKSTSLL